MEALSGSESSAPFSVAAWIGSLLCNVVLHRVLHCQKKAPCRPPCWSWSTLTQEWSQTPYIHILESINIYRSDQNERYFLSEIFVKFPKKAC